MLDEVLAVGDEAFQRKCDDFFTEIRKDPTKTVILVTHMNSVKKYCTRAMMIKDGEVVAIGDTETVTSRSRLPILKRRKKSSRQTVKTGSRTSVSERFK